MGRKTSLLLKFKGRPHPQLASGGKSITIGVRVIESSSIEKLLHFFFRLIKLSNERLCFIWSNHFSRACNARDKRFKTMHETDKTLIEKGESSKARAETERAVQQVSPPFPIRLKLLLAASIILVVLVSGTIAYFIYAKYAND